MTFKCDGCAEPSCEKGEAKKAAYEQHEQLVHATYEKSITVRTGIEDFGVETVPLSEVD